MMKNYNFAIFMLLAATLFTFSSCSKDDDKVQNRTRTELLTANPWKISSWTVNPAYDFDQDGTTETNLFPFIGTCTRDDLLIFNANNTYTEDEGATKCASTDPQVITTGTWAFSADENRITFNPDNRSPYTENITELTATTLTTTNTLTDSTGTYTFTTVYSH